MALPLRAGPAESSKLTFASPLSGSVRGTCASLWSETSSHPSPACGGAGKGSGACGGGGDGDVGGGCGAGAAHAAATLGCHACGGGPASCPPPCEHPQRRRGCCPPHACGACAPCSCSCFCSCLCPCPCFCCGFCSCGCPRPAASPRGSGGGCWGTCRAALGIWSAAAPPRPPHGAARARQGGAGRWGQL